MSHEFSSLSNGELDLSKNRMRNVLKIGQVLVKLSLLCVLCSCSHLFYQPIKGAIIAPERFGANPEEIWLSTSDGERLHAWAIRAKNPHSTLLLFHGNAENMSTHFVNLLWIVEQGFDLLIFDYRGYGFSSGEPTQAGVYLDALSAMAWAQDDHKKRETKKLIFYGQSLGGQVMGRAVVDFVGKKDISLLVFDSTFRSYKDVASRKFLSRWWLTPFYPLARILVSDEFASKDVIDQIETPTLVMHSPKDRVVDYQGGQELYKGLKSQKWWWTVEEGQHTDAFHISGGKYRDKFLDLVSQEIRVKSSY